MFQKNTPGQDLVSVIAKIMVHTNMITSINIDQTIRVVKLPLKKLKVIMKSNQEIKYLVLISS